MGAHVFRALMVRCLRCKHGSVSQCDGYAARSGMEVSKQLDVNSRVSVPVVIRLAPGTYTVLVTLGDHSYTSSMIKL